jgi:hypothetical protein
MAPFPNCGPADSQPCADRTPMRQAGDYDGGMYLDALSFLEDERDAFRAYEALDALTDEQLDVPVDAADGWSGRDLMGHLVDAQEIALAAAKELAVGERSPAMDRFNAEWDATPDAGDRINAEAIARFRALPIAEVRRRFRTAAGEMRGYLTVVPESRWVKHTTHMSFFIGETIEHYEDHQGQLGAILEAARS